MSRPRHLADVARAVASEEATLDHAIAEFVDEFYSAHFDRVRQQSILDATPEIVGDAYVDATIGAVGEHLARRWDLSVPDWTLRREHNMLEAPRFNPQEVNLRGILLVESPPAFRSRMLFVASEPLRRARFPKDSAQVEVSLPWPDKISRAA